MSTIKNNSYAKIALLLVGIFVTAIVVIIAFDVSKNKANISITTANINATEVPDAAAANLNIPPVQIQYSSRLYAATGIIDSIDNRSLLVNATVMVNDEPTKKLFTVSTTDTTILEQIDQSANESSEIGLAALKAGDTITFRSDQDLLRNMEVTATIINKLIK
ncbi:MAG: hypothetical protein V1838_01090 [Patescibacteria group bacterium]